MNNNRDIYGRQTIEVRNLLGEYPIVEADADILIYVTGEDARDAVPGDPNNCIFAKACKRSYGSRGVLFFPTVAYIDMPNEKGERVILRACVKEATRRAIEDLDIGGFRKSGTFRLYAMPKAQTLKRTRELKRKRAKALKAGKRKIDPTRSAAARKAQSLRKAAKYYGLRDGGGMVREQDV